MKFIAAILLTCSLLAITAHAQQPQPQQPPQIILQRPCILRPFARMRWNRLYAPRYIAVPVQPAQPMRWVLGRWEPVQK